MQTSEYQAIRKATRALQMDVWEAVLPPEMEEAVGVAFAALQRLIATMDATMERAALDIVAGLDAFLVAVRGESRSYDAHVVVASCGACLGGELGEGHSGCGFSPRLADPEWVLVGGPSLDTGAGWSARVACVGPVGHVLAGLDALAAAVHGRGHAHPLDRT